MVYMPCFVPLPLSSPPLCLCCFPSQLAHASGVWTECSRFSPSRAQHVRRCLLEVVLVPVSASLFLSPVSRLTPSSLRCCCQSDDLCKSAAKLPGGQLCELATCTHVCSTHVLQHEYGLTVRPHRAELFGRPLVMPPLLRNGSTEV